MAGVKEAHHVYFHAVVVHAVVAVGDEKRKEDLEQAYRLARDF